MELYSRHIDIIKACLLFDGISERNILDILGCMSPRFESYKKGEIIFFPSKINDEFGIVITGMVFGERVDFTGNRSVAGAISKKGVFGEILVSGQRKSPSITIYAAEDSHVLLLSFQQLLNGDTKNCAGYDRLIKNMFLIISEQYFAQNDRLYYLTRKTLRAKISAYLTDAASASDSDFFNIPYNRDELASYLCADRTALSRELSRMKAEGLIDYSQKSFKLMRELGPD